MTLSMKKKKKRNNLRLLMITYLILITYQFLIANLIKILIQYICD